MKPRFAEEHQDRGRVLVVYNGPEIDAALQVVLPRLEVELIPLSLQDLSPELVKKYAPDLILLDLQRVDLQLKDQLVALAREQQRHAVLVLARAQHRRFIESFVRRRVTKIHYLGRGPDEELLDKARNLLSLAQCRTQLQRQARVRDILEEVIRLLTRNLEPREAIFCVVAYLARALDMVRCSLVRLDPSGDRGMVLASSESFELRDFVLLLSRYPEIEYCILERKPLIIRNIEQHRVLLGVRGRLPKGKFRSLLVVPVLHRETVIGVLHCKARQAHHPLGEQLEALLGLVAGILGQALHNEVTPRPQDQPSVGDPGLVLAEFGGAIKHVLNQPLTAILGYSNLLSRRLGENDPAFHPVRVIQNEAMRMAELVRNIGETREYRTEQYVGAHSIVSIPGDPSAHLQEPFSTNTFLAHLTALEEELEHCFQPLAVLETFGRHLRHELPPHRQAFWIRDLRNDNLLPILADEGLPLFGLGVLHPGQGLLGSELFADRLIRLQSPLRHEELVTRGSTFPGLEDWPGMLLPLSVSRSNLALLLLLFEAPVLPSPEQESLLLAMGRRAALELRNLRLFERLRQDQLVRERLLEHAPSPALTIDLNGKLSEVNPRFVELVLRSRQELLGSNLTELVVIEDRGLVESLLEQALEGRPTEGFTLRFSAPEQEIAIEFNTFTTFLEKNRPESVLLLGRDLSHERLLEASLRQQEKLSTVGMLAASIVHELNNPLATVRLNNDFLIRKVELGHREPTTDVRHNHAIAESVERMQRYTSGLMAFVRPAAPFARVALDLNDVVRDTLVFTEAYVRGAGARLETSLSDGLKPIRGIKDQLQQLFINLIANAAQAMHGPNGCITVRTAAIDASFVGIEVNDDGPGMDQEHLASIFKPFFTTKPAGRGTGLGLSIVERIVREHEGTIEVGSEPGKGTSFRIAFPAIGEVRQGGIPTS